jgi:hypothetical protein
MDQIKDYAVSMGSAYQIFPKLYWDNYLMWSASMYSLRNTEPMENHNW